MADFVAVLNKTIDGLGERNTPAIRQKVYERAHKAIADKLAAVTPAPTAAQIDRQFQLLSDAIAAVEAGYTSEPERVPAKAAAVRSDPLADYLNAADKDAPKGVVSLGTTTATPLPLEFPSAAPALAPLALAPPALALPVLASPVERGFSSSGDPILALDNDVGFAGSRISSRAVKKRGYSGLVLGLFALAFIGGAGFGGYVYKDQIQSWIATPVAEIETVPAAVEKSPDTPTVAVEPAKPADVPPVQKLTQRMTEDGKEVDTGPGAAPSDIGEGASVAPVTTPAPVPSVVTLPEGPVPASEQAIVVGQKAVFYEEKTGTEQGTADQGAVVWSLVQDTPGLDLPQEPAIRGEVNIAEKGIKVRLTIKRNVDKTLPASHIVEMLFTTLPEFASGPIDSVQRVAMKDTEQAPGNPLIGVPASFGDGFFLIALTDEKSAIETNLSLLSKQQWMDIPIAYASGRRALLSFEKGIPGDKVFTEVIKAWEAKQGLGG